MKKWTAFAIIAIAAVADNCPGMAILCCCLAIIYVFREEET